ncbi:glycosyltransferase family 2 protein [Saccharococcus caldoxylosilyticus]|uniref:Glycosyltransferase 2-like domain-containing protein n=1 Tax=Saccharococcus caldoxylosilyticus TaxID=81408 RepID=A0A150M3A4_9BACL|nr:glycosyltransferase [Parageobacillus caldoxylosilyticus]KYD19077.1 hypothetical protein B4119_3907 [Parageobacillus caldoxylosilyticus]
MRLVSVVICTYNRVRFLASCIESVLKNNVDKEFYEILVIDNNSSDNTEEVVKSLAQNNPHIRYVKESKVGLSYARNRGIEEAKGDIIVFIDDDVEVAPNYVEEIISFFNKYPDAVCAGGKVIPVWHFEKPTWFSSEFASIIGETTYGEETRVLKFREYPIGCNMIFKKEIFNKIGLFNNNLGIKGNELYLGEEVDICDRILKLGYKIYYLPRASVYHRVHRNKVDKEYILKRLTLEGHSVAQWHFETMSKTEILFQVLIRFGVLVFRDYPILLYYRFSGKEYFSKQCKLARTKTYLKRIFNLVKERK